VAHPLGAVGFDLEAGSRVASLGGFVKAGPDKGELKMRRSEYGPLEWSLASPAPGTAARFRRWNFVLIAILLFVVLGAFVAAEAPRTGSNTGNATFKENSGPASMQHAKSIKGTQPDIHSHRGLAT